MQRTKWALAFVMMIFGLLLTTQLQVQQKIQQTPRGRVDEARDIKGLEDRVKALETERDRLTQELAQAKKAGTGSAPPALADNSALEMLAGTVAIGGRGVIVTVVEASETSKNRVRAEDLWMVINELLASGAEGIAINGQRLTSISGVREVGQRMMIYQTMTNSPYEVAAVGDPAVLETAMRIRNGVIDTLARYGVKATVARSESLRLPAFTALPQFRTAKPLR